MTTVIKPKRSETALAVPTAGALATGELAMNVTDGKFYTKNTGGTVVEVGGAGSVTLQDVLTNGNTATSDIVMDQGSQLVFEGNLGNAYETFLDVVEPTQDNVVELPNQSGVLAMDGDALAYAIVFGG